MKTITKLYDHYEQAREAVLELEAKGVPSASISLAANRDVSTRHKSVEDASGAAADSGVGVIVAGSAARVASVGAEHEHVRSEVICGGSTLLTACAEDGKADQVRAILGKEGS